jgi:hypothetical protein
MIKKIIFTTLLFFSFYSWALNSQYIYTQGDNTSSLLSDVLFPDRLQLRRPGGDGVILWNNFLEDNQSPLSIQTITSTHNLHLTTNSNFLSQSKLISVLSTGDVYLFSHKDSEVKTLKDLSKKEYRIASTNPNGVCALTLKNISEKTGIKFISVPYRLPQQAHVDFLGRHVDLICTAGTTVPLLLENKDIHVVANLTKKYNVRITQYLFAKNTITEQEEHQIIQTIIENSKNIDEKKFLESGIQLKLLFGKDAEKVFEEDKKVATELVKFIER